MSVKPLQRADFTLESNIVNKDTPIATYTVPRGYAVLARNDKNFNLLLPTVVHDIVSADEATAKEIVVSCPGITWSFPNAEDSIVDLDVYANGTRIISGEGDYTITCDHSAETVTVANSVALAEGTLIDIFYLFKPGQVSIRRISPQALDSVYDTLFAQGLKIVQEQNQISSKIGLRLDKRAWLPEMFKLTIYLNSSVVCTWTIATAGGAGTDKETKIGRFLFWIDMITMEELTKLCKGFDPAKLVVREMIGGKEV